MRVIYTVVGVTLLYASVVGIGYIVEAKHARERAAELAKK